ncbi:MAG: M42 family metallopeptidase [Lentisphaeria bacterium]|nr:M42 family metallopeptidase [Lentisphaeria bacterium]
MFNRKSLAFLETLMRTASPSGYEAEAARVFRDYLADCCAVRCDVMGNTIAALNPDAPMRVMLDGHYDEIGLQIVYISDEGLLYFRRNGGIDKLNVPSSEVDILTARGRVPGVIGKKPIHLLSAAEHDKAVELEDMWIDIGAESREEAEKLVSVGDPVAMRSNFRMLNANRFISKGTDDKIGAFVVAETMRALAKRKLNVAVFGVGAVQEEVGYRGAVAGSFAVAPQVGFAIDVDFAADLPDIPKKQYGDVALGRGPALARSCDNNIVLGQMLRDTAKAKEIPYQEFVSHRATGGTDATMIQLARGGAATALIGIPNRYMHSQVEMCDLRDAFAAVQLLTETIAAFTGEESFIPVR